MPGTTTALPSRAGSAAGRPTFTDLSKETGTCNTLWGWGAKWGDFDDDGWPDLFVANGLRSAGPEDYIPELVEMIIRPGVDFTDVASYPPIGNRSWSGYQRKKLFRNLGGATFAEVAAAAGVDNDRDGRGVALADFDGDGRLDVFQTNAAQESLLYLNRTPGGGHWLGLRLVGARGNRDAIGARVTVTGAACGRSMSSMAATATRRSAAECSTSGSAPPPRPTRWRSAGPAEPCKRWPSRWTR